MTVDFIDALDEEIEFEKNYLDKIKYRMRKTKHVGVEHIVAGRKQGRLYYYFIECKDGLEKRTYIRKADAQRRKDIQERFYLEKAYENCVKNIETLEYTKSELKPIFPDDVVCDAPLAYRDQENANKFFMGYSSTSRWKQEKIRIKAGYPPFRENELKHIASDGTLTRSKSEAFIINLLNEKGIPYVYEFPMRFGDKIKRPDFIILDKKYNREILIEHMGRMDLESYREDQYDKLGLYINHGFTPNINLLLTFDDVNGNINIPAISRMIDAIMRR